MPRAFTAVEHAHVRERLLVAGRASFERYGVRKSSVDALTRAVGIGKGSFYLFFASKEELFMTVVDRIEAAVRLELTERLDALAGAEEIAAQLVDYLFEVLAEHPVLRVLTDAEEMESLMRKLSPKRLAERRADDDAFFRRLLRRIRQRGVELNINAATLSALGRAVFALTLQRDLVGEKEFSRVRDLMVSALAAYMADES